jgi:hypothetical protein
LNCLGWIKVFNFGWNNAWKQNDFYHPIFRNLFAEATSLHLPYLGLLTIFASLWLTFKMFFNRKINLLSVSTIIFLLFSAYIYSARMALACYLIGLLFIVFKSIKKQTVKWSLLIALPLFALAFFWFSPMKERYIKVVEKDLVLPNKDQEPHEVNYRYGIWHCATDLISDHFVLGVGADNVQEKLNNCYNGFTYKSYEDLTIFGDGNQTRSFCYVDDQIEGIFRLLISDYHLPVNIGNPDEITINDFAKEIIQLTGTDQKIVYKPLPENDPLQRQPDTSLAKKILNWEAKTDRKTGLQNVI